MIPVVDDLTWQAPTRGDDPAWLALLDAIEEADQRGEVLSQDEIDDEWDSVWSHPVTDSVFGWSGVDLVAFGWIKTEVGTREHHKVSCWGGVAPSHRGRGIGRQLLDRQVARADEICATLDPTLPTQIELDAGEGQVDLVRLATGAGFTVERRFLELARPTALPVPTAVPVRGVEVVAWSDGLDESTRLAHVESFADHWGSEPTTVEAWHQWYTGHRGFRPALSRVVVDRTSGEVVAFVLAAAYPTDWGTGPREAWIQSVGTRRSWRGRGVARWALTESLASIGAADDGYERAILGVDAANPTGAVALYRGLGFEDVRVSLRLVRRA